MSTRAIILLALGAITLASCGSQDGEEGVAAIVTTPDPLVARALNDPIMVDPDLVLRSEAFAALSVRHDHALPPPLSTQESAEAAMQAATRELLESGSLVDLPLASGTAAGEALALGMSARQVIEATGAPARCIGELGEGLDWTARMPDAARIMPHGMAMQAAGADNDRCRMRIVRYVTPVGIEDALRYHFNRADRAGMTTQRYAQPEGIIDAERGSEHLRVQARPGPGGTSAVDLIYWTR